MIRVYTDINLCPKPIIHSNDKYFDTNVSKEYLDDKCRKLMESIDGAKIENESTWLISTRLGTASVTSLSSGLKTLINIYNLRKNGTKCTVDVRELGENLVPHLLKAVDNSIISLYAGRYNFVGLVESSGKFIVNNSIHLNNTEELAICIEKLGGER